MYSESDISSVRNFIASTSEGNLRKMLVGGDMTDVHLRLLIKLAKGSSEADFINQFNNETFGQLKLGKAEKAINETFWPVCKKKLENVGLLNLTAKAA